MMRFFGQSIFVFLAAMTALPAQAQPVPDKDRCRAEEGFRQQDFTLGEWDVYAGEVKIAEVRMEPVLRDCAIEEHWTVTGGRETGNGIGLFSYSPLHGDWGYHWASDTGSTSRFRGERVGPGEMRYVTRQPAPEAEGGVRVRHWTLTAMPDGTIRELSRGSEDDGEHWTIEYDLKWVRKK
ncbi:hypothetical protein D6851_10015 [Altericroceibacterium spongiae]|uniref:DUF1579 domain-containing protein n=1 Tax=Altericroceibacterium spongiae TaxID=2320269 RepID=A0A420EKL9_9SPHN|nr:hypothetical protein [Altericroceibacterium spongiae]RKF21229.1 hypothetical protein D6851_10015 [Altericroceibacterium spongiae]